MDRYSRIEAGQWAASVRWPFGSRRAGEAAESASGSLSQLLFISVRPGVQFLWTLLFLSTLFHAATDTTANQPTMIIVLVVSYGAVVLGNHYFPYDEYPPLGFFGLMCAYLLLISSLIFFTGNRTSLLGFLFFIVPIYAAHYYSYPGTMAVAFVMALARFAPFLSGSISSIVGLTLGLSAATYFVVGIITCYIVESEKIYGRKSHEFRKLLEISRNRESEVSLLCGLSKMFPRTPTWSLRCRPLPTSPQGPCPPTAPSSC